MSFLSYIAADIPIPASALLWPLSIGGEDIYTEKQYVAEVIPDLKDMDELLNFLKHLARKAGEIEIWRIWQGVEYRPVIRSKVISNDTLTVEDLRELEAKDVANETTTSYGIPVQYRIIVVSQ
ncbi:MAG: hypothetical protein IJE78_11095 [Bacteroidaceae bacterium]|nr:hypothetical protein [Bacteroidaceae bacterium]